MQDLSKIAKYRLKRQLKACKEILTYYEANGANMDYCPFCRIARQIRSRGSDGIFCRMCPWTWFVGKSCLDYCSDNFGIAATMVRKCNGAETLSARKARIEMLRNWIEKINEEISKRSKK